MKTARDLAKEFFNETGTLTINSQGEPDIDYVQWLENRLCESLDQTAKLEELIEAQKELTEFYNNEIGKQLRKRIEEQNNNLK